MKRNSIMLTFDLEEFDIPLEFGQEVSDSDQMNISIEGLQRILPVLEKLKIRATFFTTGNFARHNPVLIKELAQSHEIASHALYHSPFYQFKISDLAESKSILESIIGKEIHGFRMPRLKPFNPNDLTESGYRYDSSINPTYIPGRYNLLHKNAMPTIENGLIELPCATTPLLRFPLFWLAFKNLPLGLYAALCRKTLRKRKNVVLYFHPWEFASIGTYKLPSYIKNTDGERLTKKLESLLINLMANQTEFVTCNEFCNSLVSNLEISSQN